MSQLDHEGCVGINRCIHAYFQSYLPLLAIVISTYHDSLSDKGISKYFVDKCPTAIELAHFSSFHKLRS